MSSIKTPIIRKKKPQHIHDSPPLEYQAELKGFSGCGIYDFRKGLIAGADYFNPSLAEGHGKRWLVVRCSVRTPEIQIGINSLLAFTLENNVPMTGWKIKVPSPYPNPHAEDPRSIFHNGKFIVGFCDFYMATPKTWSGARWGYVEISNPDQHNQFGKTVRRIEVDYGGNGLSPSSKNRRPNKNWVQFVFDNRIHITHTTSPHVVIEIDHNGKVLNQHTTDVDLSVWKYGTIRGGTPPVLFNNEYWTFFHSSTEWLEGKRQYHCGAIAFESKPPFRITKITPEPLLSGSKHEIWFPGKPLVVFPCGALMCDKNEWLISYGINDLKSGWCKIPHAALESLVAPV